MHDVETDYSRSKLQEEIAARFDAAARHREDQEQGIDRPREDYQVLPWWQAQDSEQL